MKFGLRYASLGRYSNGPAAVEVAQAAEAADAGCPFSALIKASATVTVEATLEGSA